VGGCIRHETNNNEQLTINNCIGNWEYFIVLGLFLLCKDKGKVWNKKFFDEKIVHLFCDLPENAYLCS